MSLFLKNSLPARFRSKHCKRDIPLDVISNGFKGHRVSRGHFVGPGKSSVMH